MSLPHPTPATKQRHVLIVDDDPDMRELLTEILVDEGYSVESAGDGAAALAALDVTPTDTVLLDLLMPGMNGHEFLGRRAADPRLARIPVIIIGGSAQRSATTVGTYVLAKPMDVGTLLATLSRCSAGVTLDTVVGADVTGDGTPDPALKAHHPQRRGLTH